MATKNYSEISTKNSKKNSTKTDTKVTGTKTKTAKTPVKEKVTTTEPIKKYGYVIASRNLNVRIRPSVDADVIGELVPGSKCEIISEMPNWAKVIFVNSDGKEKTGYSMVKYLEIK